jgi:hypothetical protein
VRRSFVHSNVVSRQVTGQLSERSVTNVDDRIGTRRKFNKTVRFKAKTVRKIAKTVRFKAKMVRFKASQLLLVRT